MQKISYHQKIGKIGEKLAIEKLQELQFNILHTHWHYGHYEVDIIAFLPNTNILHFIEVKTRTNKIHGHPEEYVSKKKIHQMMESANYYLQQHPEYLNIQLDIISIVLNPATLQCEEFFIIKDVYDY